MRFKGFISLARAVMCVVTAAFWACQPARSPLSATGPTSIPPTAATKASTQAQPPWKAALLDRAFAVASSPTHSSHAKVRSRLQRDVAVAAIGLDMPDAALRYAGMIPDWRRGEVEALLAQWYARRGDRIRAEACLAAVEGRIGVAEGWMRERMLLESAVAMVLLGDSEKARRFASRVPQDQTGRIEAELSREVSLEELDVQCDAFDRAIATQSFDVVRSGVDGYFAVWSRVRGDSARSSRAETAIRAATPGLPPDLQIDVHVRMAGVLSDQGRQDAAMQELDAASRILASSDFSPDTQGVLARQLSIAWIAQGRSGRALAILQDTLGPYERAPEAVVDIDRADLLCPIAEAFEAAGDRASAVRVWRLALMAAAVNPNARPRAEDLCLCLLSLIRADVEPDPDLTRLIDALQAGLKAPW